MRREEYRQYGDVRLLNIECSAPYGWETKRATHLRVSMPVSYENQAEMARQGFFLADRTLGVSINLARSMTDFGSFVRKEPKITGGRQEEVLVIARQSFPTDRRFHVSPPLDQTLADKILAGWVEALSSYYLYEHREQAVGFLALAGEGDRRFVHLAAVLEQYRASGAALSLYAAAARDCKAQGVRFLEGRVSAANPAVINLYVFLGAKFAEPMDVYLKETYKS